MLDFTGTMVHFAAINRARSAAPISSDRVRVVAEKVYETCDTVDGLADGLIDDPRRCQFDVARPCRTARRPTDPEGCLTEAQVKALGAVYGDVTSTGTRLMHGFPVGAEACPDARPGRRSGWVPWIISDGQPTVGFQFMESFFKHMVTPGTPIDWRQFEPDRDMEKLTSIATLLNATNPDLTRFRGRGGKILMYFGWADPALNPMMGVNYYEQVRQTMGAGTGEFFRLFMMPGVLHCSGGLGPSVFDSITPLVDWVERGTAPDRFDRGAQAGGQDDPIAAALRVPDGGEAHRRRQQG